MRASIQRRNQQLARSITTAPSRSSPSLLYLCQSCRAALCQSNIQRVPRLQSRFQSSASRSAATLTSADESIKSNPIPKTHYEFFPKTLPQGPPPAGPFHIDPRELRKEFLQLQAIAHPDRHPTSLKTRAEATSARINEAYKTLQNPLLRAQYLLSLRGINVAEDETAKVEDPELLMEVLETREEIEAAKEEHELDEMKQVNDERIDESEGAIEVAFKRDDIRAVVTEAVRLRYWVNIKESLDGWEKGKPVVVVH